MELPRMEEGEEPRVRDAMIGAAIGVALIWLGTIFSSRLLRWPLFGLGLLFIVVMAGFILVAAWERVSAPLAQRLARARGHVREDPQLGTLTRQVQNKYWTATVRYRTLPVELSIDGEAEPSPVLLARARELVADFDTLLTRIDEFLASEARDWKEHDGWLGAEVAALRLSGILLRTAEGPDRVLLEFTGPDEDLYWTCEYVDGELSDLQYDS